MKVEKLESVGIDVKNLDEAVKLFSDIFETTFVNLEGTKVEKTITEHADKVAEVAKLRIAIDKTGFIELIEPFPPSGNEGVRSVNFKVPNLEQAKAEMEQKGIRLIAEIKAGSMKEAIFSPDDLHGIRLNLMEYDAPTFVDAFLEKRE